MLGRVKAINNPPKGGGNCTIENPRYAVDIQPLTMEFKDKGKVLRDIAVGLQYGGQQRGFFALPDVGSIVEFCFAYSSPKLIFIRGVLPWGLELPDLDINESRWQQANNVYQGYDQDNNWHRHTSANIFESCKKVHERTAELKQLMKSPKTWVGSESENSLRIVSELMTEISSVLNVLSSHTHNGSPPPDQSAGISESANTINEINQRMKNISE